MNFTGLASSIGPKLTSLGTDDFYKTAGSLPIPKSLGADKIPGAGGGSIRGSSSTWQLGKYALDKFFFNAPDLKKENFLLVYPYEFVIHDGSAALARLRLPIAPTNITIDVPSAVVTTVTMKGITEDYNGAPLRKISINGTTGIRPMDGFTVGGASGFGAQVEAGLKYLFKNTVQAVERTVESTNKLAHSFFTDRIPGNDSPVVKTQDNILKDVTGFEIIHVLQRFLDLYLSAKKSSQNGGKPLYLSFNMYKDQMYYDCTLNGYSIKKAAGTVETTYSINLTAWRRRSNPINFENPQPYQRPTTKTEFINPFARVTNALRDARTAVTNLYGVLKGINNDIDTAVLGPLNQAILLGATVANMPLVAMDFFQSFDNTWRQAIKSSISDAYSKDQSDFYAPIMKILQGKGIFSGSDPNSDPVEDMTMQQESSSEPPTGINELNKEQVDPFDDMFKNPAEYDSVFSKINIDNLPLPQETLNNINDQIQGAISLTDADVANMRSRIEDSASIISDFFGGSSEDYNRVNNRQNVVIPGAELTVERIAILSAFNDIAIAMDELTVRLRQTRYSQNQDYAQFYKDFMTTQGIDFQENTSKFYIPFPFGATLEMLAVQYLKNVNRWIEIAAINGLKEPYIDEIGSFRSLISSGSESSILIENADNLYIGQSIFIQSDTQRPERRKIKGIDVVSDIEVILTLDGNPDLSKFTTIDNAMIHIYLPNTVNPGMLIAIPSDVPVNIPGNVRINPDSQELDTIIRMAKADFMLQLTYNGESDLAFIGNDIGIARGYQNLVQAANIKVLTKVGDLLNDPSFGNPVSAGVSSADINASDILNALSASFNEDPRFAGLISSRISNKGTAVIIDLLAGINGTQAFLPFTTALPR